MNTGISLPPSKSQTMRALIFALLAKGRSVIKNPLFSPDTLAMCRSLEILGAKVTCTSQEIVVEGVHGKINEAEDVIDAGNSGIILRFIGAIGALGEHPIVLTGDHSIRHRREVTPLVNGLRQLGVRVESTRGDGGPPLILQGPMRGGRATLSGEDSQPVSALLIATAFSMNGPTELKISQPGEKPWVDLTLSWLNRFEIAYARKEYNHFTLPGGASIEGFSYEVKGDISSSLFPIAAALILEKELLIENIDLEDGQGDAKCIEHLIKRGAKLLYEPEKKRLLVKKSGTLLGGTFDVNPFIDALPILTVLGCFSSTKTQLLGASIARRKESDRIHAMVVELSKMGAKIVEEDDGLQVFPSKLTGTSLHSHADHRVAMALMVASLRASGTTQIDNKKCIAKSYPDFERDLEKILCA